MPPVSFADSAAAACAHTHARNRSRDDMRSHYSYRCCSSTQEAAATAARRTRALVFSHLSPRKHSDVNEAYIPGPVAYTCHTYCTYTHTSCCLRHRPWRRRDAVASLPSTQPSSHTDAPKTPPHSASNHREGTLLCLCAFVYVSWYTCWLLGCLAQ